MKKLALLALSAGLAAIVGCNSSSTDPGTSSGHPLVSATQGSTFDLQVTYTDTLGNQMQAPLMQHDSVIATGLTFMGKTNVVKIHQTLSNGQESDGYIALESNGDVSGYAGAGATPGLVVKWMTMPFGSGSPVTTLIFDTTISTQAVTESVKENATWTHTNSQNITIQGQTFACDGVRGDYVSNTSITAPGIPTQNMSTVLPSFYYYWSKDLGFVAKSISVSGNPLLGTTIVTQTLLSYTLR